MNTKSFRQDILKFFIIAFLVLFPHFVPLPFYSYAIICLTVIILYLRVQKKTLRDLGLKPNGLKAHTFIVGIISALLWIAFNKWVYYPLITHFFVVEPYTEYNFIRNKLTNLIITTVAAWVIGGFYEEIVFRGFNHTLNDVTDGIGKTKSNVLFYRLATLSISQQMLCHP